MLPDPKLQTLSQLQAQIVPDKRSALIQLNGGNDRVADTPVVKTRKDGQIESQTETLRDVESGVLISTKTIAWTYYDAEKGAPVDTIAIVEMDAKGKEINRRMIKHFVDGRQPEVSK